MISYHVFLWAISGTSASILSRTPLDTSRSPITLASDPTLSSTAGNTSLELTDPHIFYVCGDRYYGEGAYADSCDEAVRNMAVGHGSPTQQFTWGPREQGQYDVPLPQRWMSSDGVCYIEIELVNRHLPARASQSQVVSGAHIVIDGCIRDREYPTGGLAEHINDDENLSVGVIETSWSFTRCYGSMPPLAEASCRHLLNRMNTAPDRLYFGSEPGPDVDEILPITLLSRAYFTYRIGQHMPSRLITLSEDRRCALGIEASRRVEKSSWWAIWTAGIEISGMCARRGRAGMLNEIGDESGLIVRIFSPSSVMSSS